MGRGVAGATGTEVRQSCSLSDGLIVEVRTLAPSSVTRTVNCDGHFSSLYLNL